MMAIAAREYFMELDSVKGDRMRIIGIDAVAGAGLEAVEDGRIDVSFLYPTGGEQVIRTAMRILDGEPVDKSIPLSTAEINPESARTLLLQAGQLRNYQERIEAQRMRIDGLSTRFISLRNSLWLISSLMVAFVTLSFYAFSMNRKMRQANRALSEKNRKEEEQSRKLIALNAEIKEVTAQKLQFFTNISHEVRTPLTLILAPLDRLLGLAQGSPLLPDLELVRKNANRLLRVINQILDFRKVEGKQERLRIREVDLLPFAGEIKSYFDSMAEVKRITYTLTSSLSRCDVWIDPDLMERVLVNLLSNAFKFTPEGGTVRLDLSEEEEWIRVRVIDNGRGIQPEQMSHLFDSFYTEDRSQGTGIGLHLVKEYVRMHGGKVSVESHPGWETIFTVCLRKGKAHFSAADLAEPAVSPLAYAASRLDDTRELELLSKAYPYTVLITEDDDEVRAFLERELSDNFHTLTARNGKEALELLENNEVSLVLSDVMMPVMNGFELCSAIKGQLPFSHIPVVLLTALSDGRQRNYGMGGGADMYIQKPFDMRFVKLSLIRLLEERRKAREALLRELQEQNLLMTEPEKVGNMDDLFLRKFLQRLEEVYADPEFNVERMSDCLGLSRGHLHRKIKELTGTTPVDFLRNFRLRKAAALLRQGRDFVRESAVHTGFSSAAYFAKCFKAAFRMTPSEYQAGGSDSRGE